MRGQKLTNEACKSIIISLARKLGVDPKLVTTRLMSEDDKEDMRNGDFPIESLECHIKVWKEAGMPNYKEGKTIPLNQEAQGEGTKQQGSGITD